MIYVKYLYKMSPKNLYTYSVNELRPYEFALTFVELDVVRFFKATTVSYV